MFKLSIVNQQEVMYCTPFLLIEVSVATVQYVCTPPPPPPKPQPFAVATVHGGFVETYKFCFCIGQRH